MAPDLFQVPEWPFMPIEGHHGPIISGLMTASTRPLIAFRLFCVIVKETLLH
jgi:hypothetical protein